MRVYLLSLIDQAQRLEPVGRGYRPFESLGKGDPIESSWQCPPLQRLIFDKRRTLFLDDISGIGSGLSYALFSPAVRQHVEARCGITQQWFEADFAEAPYSILNLPETVEAANQADTELFRYDDGATGRVLSYVLKESAVANLWLFKDRLFAYDLLCTDLFKDLVNEHKFTGFWFDPVWDSELPPFKVTPSKIEIASRPEVYGPKGFRPFYSEFWPAEWHEEAKAMKMRGEPVNY